MLNRVTNWNDAYANGSNIAGGENWPEAWVEPSARYREELLAVGCAKLDLKYGEKPRNQFDIFLPGEEAKGLVVFVHGGFWSRLDRSFWSHFSSGPLSHGYAVAIPSYTLCPETRVSDITVEIAQAIEAAAEQVTGPIRLIGHSAGGHLVSRMVSHTSPLSDDTAGRIVNVVSLSGLHDLRSLLSTSINERIGLDMEEATRESPALLHPRAGLRITCWVGQGERSEFLRQNALLANVWRGLGASTSCIEEPDRHHFSVLDGLLHRDHPLTKTLLD